MQALVLIRTLLQQVPDRLEKLPENKVSARRRRQNGRPKKNWDTCWIPLPIIISGSCVPNWKIIPLCPAMNRNYG